jgi:hypothetical protein
LASVGNDQIVQTLMGDGYSPLLVFGNYTNHTFGTPLDGVSAEEAASMNPTDAERQKLETMPLHLTFDHTPSWIAQFTVPSSAIGMLRRGPATSPGPTASTAVDEAATVLVVFSADATREVQLLTFPSENSVPNG